MNGTERVLQIACDAGIARRDVRGSPGAWRRHSSHRALPGLSEQVAGVLGGVDEVVLAGAPDPGRARLRDPGQRHRPGAKPVPRDASPRGHERIALASRWASSPTARLRAAT